MTAIDFVKMCKQLKVYPLIIQFDILKKVIVKAPEYWHTPGKGGLSLGHLTSTSNGGGAGMSEMVTTVFPFKDFFKAFKIIARHSGKNTEDSNTVKFNKVTQFLQKQLDSVLRKLAENGQLAPHQQPYFFHQDTNSDSRSVYSASNTGAARPNMSPQNIYYQQEDSVKRQTMVEQEYRVPSGMGIQQQQQMMAAMSSTHSTGVPSNWRVISNSEVKSDNGTTQSQTGRAYSAAVKIFKQKGTVITKQSLKKKGGGLNIQGLINFKNQGAGGNFRTIQGKTTQSSQSTSKSQVVTAATLNLDNNNNIRRSQNATNSMTANASLLVSSSGSAGVYRATSLHHQQQEGRNKSPSLSKSMNENSQMVIKNDVTTESTLDNPRYNKFQLPQSEMSRQRDTLNPIISSTSSRGGEEGSAQKSFRIRKYSRSLSRSSRTSLHSARGEEHSPDMPQLKTIEIDNIRPNVDIKPHSQNNHHQQFKSAALPSTQQKPQRRIKASRHKQERDSLNALLGEIKARFNTFKAVHEAGMGESDTGGRKEQKVILEDEKDRRIKALEAEVARLREREQALVDKLKAAGNNIVNDL
ncbi:hypothetical protein FGO68_gene4129 [Halteria grandinella]|uniref:Uncharacterized protein n=1 Tax=Halteria grandinella TaxID=5974 RepID=A0A8J8NX61_HALGN|nr:hypothetical protein FGO68_gene4129 [Halteria grandinella]